MAIDVEDIKLCVCRIVHFSLRVSHRFVQKHPYLSGALSFLFILYIFLPSVLSFLFYSLPFLGFVVILLAIWTSKSSTIQCEKREGKSESSEIGNPVNRNHSAYLRNATSQRRRFREKSEAWSAEAPIGASVGRMDQLIECDKSKASVEVKERCSFDYENKMGKNIEVSGPNHPILGSELLVKSDILGLEGSSSQTNKSDSGGDEMKNESSSEGEDEDEEEAQEDRNKAVEWTEDDQKNLTELGLSEIERNRRLESLIARRRARKSYKRKAEESCLPVGVIPRPGHIAKVVTTKNEPFDVLNSSKEMEGGIPIPGSAPSVLLPMRNPFDLPYDPLEEKPNLMADSFHQEFTAAHLKELSYCRHESFCFGPAFPLEDEGGGMGYPRFRRPSVSDKGDHDWLVEQLLSKGGQVPHAGKNRKVLEIGNSLQIKDDMDTTVTRSMTDINGIRMESAQGEEILPNTESEFEMEPELIQHSHDESSSSSSSENHEDVISVNRGVVSGTYESSVSAALNKSLKCLVPKSRLKKEPLCDFSPSAFEKSKMEDRFSYPDKMVCHTPTYSIASDMQVEVSEMGSPSFTVDGNNSLTDVDFLSHDWEAEKEMNSGGEESWGTLSDMSRDKEKELKSRDVHEGEANEENINNVELLGVDMNSENLEQDDTSLLLEEVPNEIISDLQEVNLAGEAKGFVFPDASAPETIQSAMQSTKELKDQPPHYVLPQQPEESFKPLDDDEKALSHVIDQGDADADAIGNMENLVRTSEDIDGGLQILVKQEDAGEKTRLLEETNLECRNDDSNDPLDHRANSDHEQSQEGYNNLDQITDNGDLVEASVQGSNTTDILMPSETKEQLEFIKDNENQINVAETEFQNSNDVVTVQELEDTTTQPSNTSSVEKSQEPPKPQQIYEEEAHTINNLAESILDGKTDGETSEYSEATRRESDISNPIEDYIMPPKIPVEDSVINENKPRNIEDDDKLVDSTEVENKIIKDLSEQNGDKSSLDAKSHHDHEYTNDNLSAPNSALGTDMNVSENIAEEEVVTNPPIESPFTKVQIESEAITAVTNSLSNKDMEGDSKSVNENEVEVIPSTLERESSNSKFDLFNVVKETGSQSDVEGDSKSLKENEVVVILEKTDSQTDKDVGGDSKGLNKDEAIVNPSKLEEENSNSKLEGSNVAEETNSHKDIEGDSQILNGNEVPSKIERENSTLKLEGSNVEEETNSQSDKDMEGDSQILNENENEILVSPSIIEGENSNSKLEESNVAKEINSQFDRDIEGDSKSLNENEAIVNPDLQTPDSGHENVGL